MYPVKDRPSSILFMIWSTPALRNDQVSSRSAVLLGMTAKGPDGAGEDMVVWQIYEMEEFQVHLQYHVM